VHFVGYFPHRSKLFYTAQVHNLVSCARGSRLKTAHPFNLSCGFRHTRSYVVQKLAAAWGSRLVDGLVTDRLNLKSVEEESCSRKPLAATTAPLLGMQYN
jgi:hypothetical protein